jgi:GT2 family glycosyltransferase
VSLAVVAPIPYDGLSPKVPPRWISSIIRCVKITVYIPCHNNESTVAEALQAVRQQTRKADQLLFINDRCSDRSPQIAREHGFEVQDLVDGKGLAAARNRALSLARGDVIQGFDADAVIEPDYLEKLERKFEANPTTAAICGRMNEKFTDTPADLWRALHLSQHHGDREQVNPLFLFGSTTSCRVDAARQVGGWNERFMTNYEDVDLSSRLRGAGFDLLYAPDCQAWHLRRDTLDTVLQAHWNWQYFAHEDQLVSLERFMEVRLPTVWGIYRRMRLFDMRYPSLYPITMLMPWSCMIRDLHAMRKAIGEIGEIANVIDICRGVMQFCGAQPETVEQAARWLGELAASLDDNTESRPRLPPNLVEYIKLNAMENLPDANYWTKVKL